MLGYKSNKKRPYLYRYKGDVTISAPSENEIHISKRINFGTNLAKAMSYWKAIGNNIVLIECNLNKCNIINDNVPEEVAEQLKATIVRALSTLSYTESSGLYEIGSPFEIGVNLINVDTGLGTPTPGMNVLCNCGVYSQGDPEEYIFDITLVLFIGE